MDLKLFFSPLSDDKFSAIHDAGSVFKNIKPNIDRMPAYADADMAIVGVEENRDAPHNDGVGKGADAIRNKLYRLKKGFGRYKIVDLGNIRNGMDFDETKGRITEVCHILIQHGVLPVIIGGSHAIDYAQYRSYEGMDKLVSMLNVDAFLDMEEGADKPEAQRHIHKILLHEPNFLFSYNQLAYQSYLTDQNTIGILEKLYFEAHRLGHLHRDIAEMEPIIRNADMLSFDITAIKYGDAPGNANAQPFGLTGEEACQICWYAGLNEKLSSAGFYEYNPEKDDENKRTASVVATMIWYFIEGFYHRKNEEDFKTSDYLRFVIPMHGNPDALCFYKSKLSDKWWLEVPYPEGGERYARNCMVPCSYNDYQQAARGELPERYITTAARLL